MGAVLVILGTISFGLGYALIKVGDFLMADAKEAGVGLFLIASILLTAAIMLDRINKALR